MQKEQYKQKIQELHHSLKEDPQTNPYDLITLISDYSHLLFNENEQYKQKIQDMQENITSCKEENHIQKISLNLYNGLQQNINDLNQVIIDTRINDNINHEDILAHLQRNPIDNTLAIRRILDIQRETNDMENQFPLL